MFMLFAASTPSCHDAIPSCHDFFSDVPQNWNIQLCHVVLQSCHDSWRTWFQVNFHNSPPRL